MKSVVVQINDYDEFEKIDILMRPNEKNRIPMSNRFREYPYKLLINIECDYYLITENNQNRPEISIDEFTLLFNLAKKS